MIINSRNRHVFQICLLVLVAIVVLGIGYASISAINLIINSNATASVNEENFKVHFIEAKNIEGTSGVGGTSLIESDDTIASFSVMGLSKVGDYALAKYVVKNDSNGIGADISLDLITSNTEYFKVTESITDTQLQVGDTTLATIKVELIKTPINDSISTSVTAKLIVNPMDNEVAIKNEPAQIPCPFESDSWMTIKENINNNNTDQYKLGDIKNIRIGDKEYKLRLVNKTKTSNCDDSNYSQTACGFVVEFVDIVTYMKMNDNSSNVGGYNATYVKDYLNDDFYYDLPIDLQNAIVETRVISGHGKRENTNFILNNQKVFLLSGMEIFGQDGSDSASHLTKQLDFYQELMDSDISLNDYLIKKYNNSSVMWWLRSATSGTSGYFRIIYNGNIDNRGSSNSLGVSPAFRIF